MTGTVRVCRLHARGDLRVETAPLPPPGPGEVTVALGAGGICGSDLHYLHEGGVGAIRVREPIILGHEAAGHVEAFGPGVEDLAPGDLVALNPSRPCGRCPRCREGLRNHCPSMAFSGSAMHLPHAQGFLRERITLEAARCVKLPGPVSAAEAACAEPLAVCLHAARRAGDLLGRRVLVTGAGPIGCLCAAVAVRAGAAEIVVTDLQDRPLAVARQMGTHHAVNVARDPEGLAPWRDAVDVAFEACAAAPAIAQAAGCLRPRGRLVQIGSGGAVPMPLGALVTKEIDLLGSFRFDTEFAAAADAIGTGGIDVRPVITGAWPLAEAAAAFEAASDRGRSVKVQLTF